MSNEIEDLQLKVAYQEDAIHKLSDQIAVQDKELLEAKRHIHILREKLMDLVEEFETLAPASGAERPPHY